MFSDAINSISWRWRPSSPAIAAAISGSASASEDVKNESGAEAVLGLLDEGLMSEISPPPQALRALRAVTCGGRKMTCGIPHRPEMAKRLRYPPDIYARYGGDGADARLSQPPPFVAPAA